MKTEKAKLNRDGTVRIRVYNPYSHHEIIQVLSRYGKASLAPHSLDKVIYRVDGHDALLVENATRLVLEKYSLRTEDIIERGRGDKYGCGAL